MNKNTPVSVGDHFDDFIERQVQTGRYQSPSDVMRAGLRLLEEQELKIERLRAALIEGEESGAPAAFDLDDLLGEMRRDRAEPRRAAMCSRRARAPI
jgi:antitoxin ParD1/3/4